MAYSLQVEAIKLTETRDISLVKIIGPKKFALKFARTSAQNENNRDRIQSVFDEITILEGSKILNDYFICSGNNEKFVWFLVNWVDGKTVHQYLKSAKLVAKETAKESDFKTIFIQTILDVVSAVEQLHQNNIFHRDIQPNHFILDEQENIRIIDFGVSSFIDRPMKYKGALVHFLAPELASQLADGPQFLEYYLAQEIFSLGSMFYFNYYGRVSTSYDLKETNFTQKLKLIGTEGASAILNERDDSFPELLDFLKDCTNIKVDRRIASLTEMKDRLNQILSSL